MAVVVLERMRELDVFGTLLVKRNPSIESQPDSDGLFEVLF
jgi:hypothetical protein